jgi:hypothetical protein
MGDANCTQANRLSVTPDETSRLQNFWVRHVNAKPFRCADQAHIFFHLCQIDELRNDKTERRCFKVVVTTKTRFGINAANSFVM